MTETLKSKRTKVIALSLIVVFLFSTGLATLALLADKTKTLTNSFEPGNVTTEIEEEFEPTDNYTVFDKTPKVKNTGKSDCYVRVRVVASPEEALKILKWNLGEETGMWTDGGDGYYYYNGVLEIGTTTATPLFEQVEVTDTTIDGFEVTVYQEAVQTSMNLADGSRIEDADAIWDEYERLTREGAHAQSAE